MRGYTLINGDLTTADADFICHQVNCMGVMGSGVAKAIRNRYSKVYADYRVHCNNSLPDVLLGSIQCVQVNAMNWNRPYYVVNMFSQKNFGSDGKQYTDIEAFKKCLNRINEDCAGMTIAFPWMIGCVRGGASWDEVLPLIMNSLDNVKEIKFYKI